MKNVVIRDITTSISADVPLWMNVSADVDLYGIYTGILLPNVIEPFEIVYAR